MSNKKTVPSLRFRGFSEPWEEKNAAILADYSKGNGYSKSDLTKMGTPIILYGRLYTKYEFVINDVDTFTIPKRGSVYSQGNEVIIPASGETAEDIARAAAIEKPGILLGGDLNILRPFNFINPLFLALAISNGKPQKDLIKKAQGKSVVHIHNSDIQGIILTYPSKIEQNRIVEVFRNLDRLITLEQQKYDKLNTVKQSMLEKMFPQKGAKVPEIRFKGFSEPWEEKKLGEIAPLRGGFAFKSSQYDNNGIPIIRISNILSDGCIGNEFIYYHEQQNDEVYSLSDAAVLIAMSGATTGKVAILHEKKSSKYYQNQRVGYFVPTLECDYGFIAIIVRSHFFSKQLSAVLVAGAQPNVSSKDIDSFEFLIPVSKEEQQAIGSYFQNLDHLITSQGRKIEKLRNLKKACLEKMFV